LRKTILKNSSCLIDIHGEEMILRDGDKSEDCLKDFVSHKQSGNPTFSLHKEIASPKVIPEFHDSKGCTFLSEEMPDTGSFNDIHPYFDDDPLSGSTTYSANSLLKEFADELALISYPPDYDDYRVCDIESDIREIEFLLFQGEDSDFKDSIDQSVLTHLDDLFVDLTPEMFAEEQPPDYSFPPRFDVYPDDFLEIESDDTFNDDSFDFDGEKIKEAELLIDQLDLPCYASEFHDSKGCNFLSEELPDIDSFNDIHPYFDDDPLSGSTTFSANSLLEEFADELALISYPLDYDDYRAYIESDIREIEFLLFQGKDSDFKDSIDQSVLTHCDDLFVDPTPKMFIDEQPPDYSFPPRFDVYPDDFLEIESDANFDYDSFNSEGEKINEADLLIDQLDLPCDILSEYDSFNSQDFSRDDVLFSPDNEDKVFNPRILIHEKSVKIITRFTQEKKLAVSFAFWLEVLEAKTVEVLKVGTEHNAADALTKAVPGHKLQHCLELLSVGIG
nr:hypothetical protein [Tanacetum cinerariifolium]